MGLGSNRLLRLGGMAWWVELLLFSLLLVVIGGGMLWPEAAEAARTKHYKWRVDYRFWAPDCVEKLIISINGQYPGPTIRARVGDLVVVELHNLLPTETVLLHWHGILQVPHISFMAQCSVSFTINPTEVIIVNNRCLVGVILIYITIQ